MKRNRQENDPRKDRAARDAVIANTGNDVVQRYGAGVKEHLVAYGGVDNESGKALKKGLDSISHEKISEEYRNQSIRAQAGYAAEVKTAARENADAAVKGHRIRSARTDDLPKDLTASDGTSVGGTNNQLYDIVSVSEDGAYIEGTARQLKYVGKNADECCTQLMQKKFDKYRDADAQIEVPKDYYDGVKQELDRRIEKAESQLKHAEQSGNAGRISKQREQLERLRKTKRNLKKGQLTVDEAIEARLHPKLSTAKDIARLSHQGGLEAAKTGALIGGAMSFVHNVVAVIKGDKKPKDAVVEVASDTASAACLSYATGAAGSALKGGMQNATSIYAQTLSKTSFPAMIGTTVVEASKTLYRYFKGDIDGAACLTELGEKGSGVVASSIGAFAGQMLIPIPVLGGLIGSMCGYALSSVFYGSLTTALREAKMAREERRRIEEECEAAIGSIREYRIQMELVIRNYLSTYTSVFEDALLSMNTAFQTGEVDLVVEGANRITQQLGQTPLFRTEEEFEELMMSGGTILL